MEFKKRLNNLRVECENKEEYMQVAICLIIHDKAVSVETLAEDIKKGIRQTKRLVCSMKKKGLVSYEKGDVAFLKGV